VLKPTGSLYLHCDPTASHYLKVMLDVIFGARNFRNEIVWVRDPAGKGGKRVSRQWPRNIDVLLFYTKSDTYAFHQQYLPLSDVQKHAYRYQDARGRYKAVQRGNYSDEMWERFRAEGRIHISSTGKEYLKYYLDEAQATVGSVWDDILGFGTRTAAAELLGYPTQKPLALLERILQASSNEGDTILDPFCGCGTAIVAAHKLNRRWIGIDITHLAIALIKYRLSDMFNLQEGTDYRVVGEPTSVEDARALAQHDRDEFQKWAIGLIPRARPYQDKKGKDTGIDGVLFFKDDLKDAKRALIQVKSGKVSVKDVRDFRGVLEREGATLGLFVSFGAADAGYDAGSGAGGVLHDAVGQPAHSAFAGAHGRGVAWGQGFRDTERGVVDGRGAGGARVAVWGAGGVGDVGNFAFAPLPTSPVDGGGAATPSPLTGRVGVGAMSKSLRKDTYYSRR
jgi:site-specific DNA-methyltransferase (adenine-specific)